MYTNEIYNLEKEVEKLTRQLERAKDNAVKVTIAPIENKLESESTLFTIQNLINTHFEHLIYSYDSDKNVMVLWAEGYQIWPTLNLAITTPQIKDPILKECLRALSDEIRVGKSEDKTYYLK